MLELPQLRALGFLNAVDPSVSINSPCVPVYVLDDDEDDSDDEGTHSVSQSACSVVWEGTVLDRAFTDWKVSPHGFDFYMTGDHIMYFVPSLPF